MKRFGLLSTSALFGLSMAFAAPAYAQDQQNEETCTPEQEASGVCDTEQEIESGEPATDEQSLTVTGSRIRRPNLESNIPITSVQAEDLTSQGDVNIGDALNDLPSLRSTFSQANSNRFIGTTGLNLLDLRGLGISRTLVLVNGRRHITALAGDFIVDVNTIPSDLIERVDVITGGNSAVYGSDAVAGVVNFILRRDFDGIRLRGQAGISQQGDRGIQFVSLTAGRNFFDDRANLAVNLEYANAEALYFIDRPDLTGAVAGRCQFNTTEPVVGEPLAGDGVADTTFQCGTRNLGISNGGAITANASAAQCQSPTFFTAAVGNQRCLNWGTTLGQPRVFVFAPGGAVVENVPGLDLRQFGGANFVGGTGLGATLRDTGQLAPGLDRYTANLLFNMDVSNFFQPFLEAKYVRVFARQEGQPSFFQSTFPAFFGAGNDGSPRGLRCDNAFLTAGQIASLQQIGRCLGGATSTETLTPGRFNVDFGGRGDLVTRQTYRGVAGVRGDFFDDWNYEVSFNYGHVDIQEDHINDLVLFDQNGNLDGFLLAHDAVRNAAGQIVCRVNADANPANDRPDCVPINVFGVGQPSAAALDFVNTTSTLDGRATQYNAVAYINGDLSQLFEFPGGPIRFVIGGEWRRETAFQQPDALSGSGGTFFNAFQVFDPPAMEVLEAFGEIELPLLRDMPFAHELTLAAAGRYSDYNTAANTTFSYNVNGTWAPVRDIRFRANYSQAVRVPTLSDLHFPAIQNFAQILDPCDFRRRGPETEARAMNCTALGAPAGLDAVITNTQTAEIISSGNPFLIEETGRSLTLGAVVTPRWIQGLSITVDYYRIRVDDLIAVLGAQTILNQCVDLPNVDNQFCQLIFPRQTVDDPATPYSEIGALQSPALISAGVNFQRQEADGIDFELAYRRTLSNGHRLNIRSIATYVLRRNNFTSPTNPLFSSRQLSNLGDPQWAANFTFTYGVGPWDLRYSANYIGKMTTTSYENLFPHDGRPPQNADARAVNQRWYPDQIIHSIRLSHRVSERFNFYMGMDNVFDSPPPFDLLGTGAGDPYDQIGRYFYAGATIDF